MSDGFTAYLEIFQGQLWPHLANQMSIFKPDEHEADSAYVRTVAVIEDPIKLFLGDFHGPKLVHEAIGGRNDASSADTTDSTAHTRLVGGFL